MPSVARPQLRRMLARAATHAGAATVTIGLLVSFVVVLALQRFCIARGLLSCWHSPATTIPPPRWRLQLVMPQNAPAQLGRAGQLTVAATVAASAPGAATGGHTVFLQPLAGFEEAMGNFSTWKSYLLMTGLAAMHLPQVQWWEQYAPALACPPHAPLKRYGSSGDGGKLLCALEGLQAPCTVLSFGSNGGGGWAG